jgi:glutamate dehydrogenase (NADP+)
VPDPVTTRSSTAADGNEGKSRDNSRRSLWSVVEEQGIDLEVLKQVKEVERARLSDYAERVPSSRYVQDGSVWDVPCQVAMPSASQNELAEDAAVSLVRNGCQIVVEGANMPTTPAAVWVLREAGVGFGPGKAANAGGVATSALEMQ